MQITEQVTLLDIDTVGNVYLIKDTENILVDSGVGGRSGLVIGALDRIGVSIKSVRHIILTHHDVDHVGNAATLAEKSGAKIWISEEDRPYYMGELKRKGVRRFAEFFRPYKKPSSVNPYPLPYDFPVRISIIPTPGHTPGHIAALYKEALFSGDLLDTRKGFPYPHGYKFTADVPSLVKSLNGIMALQYTWICPGHGVPMQTRYMPEDQKRVELYYATGAPSDARAKEAFKRE